MSIVNANLRWLIFNDLNCSILSFDPDIIWIQMWIWNRSSGKRIHEGTKGNANKISPDYTWILCCSWPNAINRAELRIKQSIAIFKASTIACRIPYQLFAWGTMTCKSVAFCAYGSQNSCRFLALGNNTSAPNARKMGKHLIACTKKIIFRNHSDTSTM